MSKVVVIGGGASGVIAAIKASNNNDVTILEGNDKLLKKLLLTGNGKCNYWNESIDETKYCTDDKTKLNQILKYKDETLNFLYKLGLYPKIKNGYYYPYSESSNSVREILIKQLKKSKVKIITDFKVDDIKYTNEFIIKSKEKIIKCDKLIIATGSKSYPKTGSDGSGYNLATSFNHTINEIKPSLVPLKLEGNYLKDWDGIRTLAHVKLINDNKIIKEETGEIQLTNYGVSGICIFNLSGKLKNKSSLEIDFLPNINNLYNFLTDRDKEIGGTVEDILESIFNYKLMFVLLKKSGIKTNTKWNELKETEKHKLCETIKNFSANIIGTLDFDRAQTCSGGIPLNEINETMQSKYNKNLYFTGEIIDVNGDCGGYNLAFSFITGYICGRNLNDSN
ncbi:MAG: aminoacetone oxidase family FAD-binding enzyme [Bacilli bacterium]|nr:aminoacetone oxidase family FAD-binding enzyme [Bacilli bacterium]